MIKDNIKTSLLGAACLVLGWGAGTILHEFGHLTGAYAFGLPATLGQITLTTGSVFVQGDLTGTQTAVIAIAGSLCLMVAGGLMVRLSGNPVVRMIGIVFLCRAWVDMIPVYDLDGGILAGSSGFYRNFVSDTMSAFQAAGCTLYNEAILVNVAGSLPIRIGKQFGSYRKLGKMHQNVLIFYKGDPKQIKADYGDIVVDMGSEETQQL